MSSDGRLSTRSPTNSRSGSYRDAPGSRLNGGVYERRTSAIEENQEDPEYEQAVYNSDEPPASINQPPAPPREDQYIAALRYRFPNRPKSDYSYRTPVAPATVVPPAPVPPTPPRASAGAYESTMRPGASGTAGSSDSGGRVIGRPPLRPVDPNKQNAYARQLTSETRGDTPAAREPTVRITEPTRGTITRGPTSASPSSPARAHESTFEKVHSHGGPVSYLGTGTFSQFERCLQNCLERERRETGIASHITRQDLPSTLSAYDYDPQAALVSSSHVYPSASSSHQFIDYPSSLAATLMLDDIRHINVALSKTGISLFPYQRFQPGRFSPFAGGRHTSGEVVSACRFVDEDTPSQAVQNVWSAIQHQHQPDPWRSGY